jgi:hypothetical protein
MRSVYAAISAKATQLFVFKKDEEEASPSRDNLEAPPPDS